MIRRRPLPSRGFTLVEMLVSMVAMTLLMSALAGAIALASRALPDPASGFSASLSGSHAVEQIAGELTVAKSFTANTERVVEFTVADRDNDTVDETIRYEWSGIAGSPLTRTYNEAAPATVAGNVHEFELRYDHHTESETVMQEQTTTTPDGPLASFNGWSGVTASVLTKQASTTSWTSEYFEITPPAGANSLTFTKADVRLKGSTLLPLPGVTVAIHRSRQDTTYAPAASPIGTPTTVPSSSLATTMQWIPVTLSGVTVTDPSRTDYCLVVKGTVTTAAWVEGYSANSAPPNGMYAQWTSDGGSSWSVASKDKDKQDFRYTIYGYFTTTTNEPVIVHHQFLRQARVILRIGSTPSTRVETSIVVSNEPEVTGL